MCTLQDFANRLRILNSIDLDELQRVGLMFNARPDNPAWNDWRRFRGDPFRWLVNCDQDQAEKLWSIVEARSKDVIRVQV